MKAVVISSAIDGDSDEAFLKAMHVEDFPRPAVGKGELLLRVRASGLNPADYKALGFPGMQFPHVPGMDIAGEVVELGPDVAEKWKVGDRVVVHASFMRNGGFAEFCAVPALACSVIPESISFVDAAALPCAGYTAYLMVSRKLNLKLYKTAIVQGAAGGVGGFLVQFCKLHGLTVWATCSSRNFDRVKGLGADVCIDYNTENVAERVASLSAGSGVDIVFDTVSIESAQASMEYLAFNGVLACFAGLPSDPSTAMMKAQSIMWVMLGGAHLFQHEYSIKDLSAMGDEVLHLLQSGKIDPMVSKVLKLEDVPQGLLDLKHRHVSGKIVLKID